MKKKVRDILVVLVTLLGVSFLYRTYTSTRGSLVRVLAFHDVADKVWFEALISEIVKKYNLLTPEKFHDKEFRVDKINILLTFDDGYQTWIENVLPVLEKFNLKGLFFVNSGLVDVAGDLEKSSKFMNENLLISPKKALTWEGARTLVSYGHTVGGHTTSHVNLAKMERGDVEKEIRLNKEKLESELKIKLIDFAYPFGRHEHFTLEVTEVAKNSGYSHLYTAETGFFDKDPYSTPRTLLERNQRIQSVIQWIDGAYDIVTALVSWK